MLGLSQGELLEVFLDLADKLNPDDVEAAVKSKKTAKRAGRVTTSAVTKKLKGLPKDKLEAIEKFIEEQLLQAKKDAANCAEHGVFR